MPEYRVLVLMLLTLCWFVVVGESLMLVDHLKSPLFMQKLNFFGVYGGFYSDVWGL